MNNIAINWKGFKLPLHKASVYYLGGVDPNLQWEVRGISGHSSGKDPANKAKLNEQIRKVTAKLTGDAKTHQRTKTFINDVCQLTEGLMAKGPQCLQNYLGNKKFKFIIGAMRTGGTYLYKELCQVYGQPWSSLNLEMTHDSIPSYNCLSFNHYPNSFLVLIFEMAQFFVWVKREIPGDIVVQKRIAYAHALPFLNALLGKNAEYILTLRHPVPLGYSFAKLEGQDPWSPNCKEPPGWYGLVTSGGKQMTKAQWHKLSYFKKVLLYWERYYMDVAEAGPFKDNLSLVQFGKPTENFIRQRSRTCRQKEVFIEPFQAQEKELAGELTMDEIESTMASVRERWNSHGLSLPEMNLM
jgi:hypothetical protein